MLSTPKIVPVGKPRADVEKERRSYDQRMQLFKDQVHLHRRSLTTSLEPVRKKMQTSKKIINQAKRQPGKAESILVAGEPQQSQHL